MESQRAREKSKSSRLLDRLQNPAPGVLPALQEILGRSQLYTEEFISDHDALRTLLAELLTDTDWEAIATSAANSVREQVRQRVDEARISAELDTTLHLG